MAPITPVVAIARAGALNRQIGHAEAAKLRRRGMPPADDGFVDVSANKSIR
jgi:hypothetical protein